MSSYIDPEFHTPEEAAVHRPLSADRIFATMLLLSAVLHVGLPLVFSVRGRMKPSPSVVSIDLADVAAAPAAKPATTPPRQQASPEPPAPPEVPVQKTVDVPPPKPTEAEQLQKQMQESVAKGAENPKQVEDLSLGLGMSRGKFSSIGDGTSLRFDIREYYFLMMRKLNESWWVNGGPPKELRQEVVLNLYIARNGTLVGLVMVKGSGSKECDQRIIEAVKKASPLPPLPIDYELPVFNAPVVLEKPLALLSAG